MAFAYACARFDAGAVRVRFETSVASTLVRCDALAVLASILAEWRTAIFGSPDETFQTLAHTRFDAHTVFTRGTDRFALAVHGLRVVADAGAEIRRCAFTVFATWLADWFAS